MQQRGQVVVFEDDEDVRLSIQQSLELQGMTVAAYAGAESVIKRIDAGFTGVVVTDLRLPGLDGRSIFRTLRETDPEIPVIMVTGHGELQEAVDLVRNGLYDFLSKPFPADRLVASVRNALEQRALVLDNRRLRQPAGQGSWPLPLLGDSPAIQRLRQQVLGVADVDVNVLVTGETGTGKHAVARALHDSSRRRSRPFIVFDCAALPDSVAELELFGVPDRPGGMLRRTLGCIETAAGGTLFLDNIDSLSLTTQARVLRATNKGSGADGLGTDEAGVSCRIVAASAADLPALCHEGAFRPDLYFRLNAVNIALPALRHRREDLPVLLAALVARSAQRFRRPVGTLTPVLRRRLLGQEWPGNIRELAHFADRLVLGLEEPLADDAATTQGGNGGDRSLPERMEAFEAQQVREALRAAGGDVRGALALLRIPRKTFYDKLARHGIDIDAYRR
jgi:two-component system C4-dicarboxylate transport response regulator DctD